MKGTVLRTCDRAERVERVRDDVGRAHGVLELAEPELHCVPVRIERDDEGIYRTSLIRDELPPP